MVQPTISDKPHKIYSVSKLTAEIKTLLERQFSFVWVSGEISNFSVPASGHFYFTLKDESAQIRAVMFRGQNRLLKFLPEDGMNVTGLGRLSVYEPRGSYQIIFELLEPKGIGAFQIAFEQLKAKLAAEGLFDEQLKRPLPFLPHKISIITSPTGAVIHDIIQIVTRRYPNIQIEIIPVQVQGEQAVKDIVKALDLLDQRDDTEVAILARGGGSLEDLAAFNAEAVARKISIVQFPVVSAIGHETDFTITDFVADLRASTPSAAAELIVPVKSDLKLVCRDIDHRLIAGIRAIIKQNSNCIKDLKRRLVDPRKKIQDYLLRIDELSQRLNRYAVRTLSQHRERLSFWQDRMNANMPLSTVRIMHEKLNITNNNLLYYINNILKYKMQNLHEQQTRLQALNPKSILQRGFSITRTIPDSTVIRDSDSVSLDQNLEILLASGTLTCQVKGKRKNGPKIL